jgi:hypothetical protein
VQEPTPDGAPSTPPEHQDVASLVRQVLEEFTRAQQAAADTAYQVELDDERKRREQLEKRLNDLVQENKQNKLLAEEADRSATVRAELQRLGVGKVDLAFKAIKEDIVQSEDGRLVGKTEDGEVVLKDYLAAFVHANPEFLPARIPGGSGIGSAQRTASGAGAPIGLEHIRPGMSSEDKERARHEIARIAAQALRGS